MSTDDVARDRSPFIENAAIAVEEHLALGASLAALIVLALLDDVRGIVNVAIAIPTSVQHDASARMCLRLDPSHATVPRLAEFFVTASL